MSYAIEVADLGKSYRRTAAGHKLRTLKSALLERSLIAGLRPEEAILALEGVSFQVRPGEALGLVGSNGSGKSTLLKLLAGILRPTSGSVRVQGRLAALIELGAGFHPEISGRENIFINGAVLGLSRRQIEQRYQDIVAFSGLEDFIEEPVKNYSSGMYVRLGFAVAIHTDPDILLVDEVLAVGDEAFAHRCLRRIEELLGRGKTLVLVSHSLSLIEEVCDRALWIDRGHLRLDGEPRRVLDAYRQSVAEAEGRVHREIKENREESEGLSPEAGPEVSAAPSETATGEADATVGEGAAADQPEANEEPAEAEEVLRWGSGEARIEQVRLLVGGEERYHLRVGEDAVFEIDVHAHRRFRDFVFGIALSTPRGTEVWGTNTDLDGLRPDSLEPGQGSVKIACPGLRLAAGEYLVDVAVHAKDGTPYDYRRKLLSFSVIASEGGVGVYLPEHRWSFSGGIAWQADNTSSDTANTAARATTAADGGKL